MASPTTNKGYTYPAHGGGVNTWDSNLNGNFEYQDLNLGGYYSITASSSITVANTFNSTYATIASTARSITMSASLAQNLFYNLLGTLQSSLAINMPAAGSIYVFGNSLITGSSYDVVAQPTGGSGVTIPSGGQDIIVFTSSGANYAKNVGVFVTLTAQSVAVSSALTAQTITASSAVSAQSVTASSAMISQSVTASSAVTGGLAGGSMIAVKADQGTGAAPGASITKVVPPGAQQYHPSAAKAWVRFVWTGAVITIGNSYNVASVTRSGTGIYAVNFTTSFSNVNYVAIGNAQRSTTLGGWIITPSIVSVSQCVLVAQDASFVAIDPTAVYAVFFGDQ